MSTQTDLFVEFDYGHDVRALIRYPLLAVNDENVDPTVSRYGLWRNGWVHLEFKPTAFIARSVRFLTPKPPRAVLRVCSVAVRGTLKGAPEPAAGNLAWGPRRWL
jgi:hypothetical protein